MLLFGSQIQSTIVPEVILKEWAQRSYQSSADYWTFRKQVMRCFYFGNKLTILKVEI